MENYNDFDIKQLKIMMKETGKPNSRRLMVELIQRLEAAYCKLDEIHEMLENRDNVSLDNALSELKNPPIRKYPMSKISDELTEAIYLRITTAINEKLSSFDSEGAPGDSSIAMFYHKILESVNIDEHVLFQNKYLNPNGISKWGNHLKFMHPTRYFDSKYNLAVRLGLIESEKLKILEMGCRGGHFTSIANFIGHDAIGLEAPSEFYQDLCNIWNVPFIEGAILDTGELPLLEKAPFDLITGFSITFNKKQGIPWNTNTWDVFISNIKNQWLNDGGRMIIQLSRNSTSDVVWEHLSSISKASDHSKMEIIISN